MPNPKRPGRIALTPDEVKELKGTGSVITEIERAIKVQKRLKADTTDMESRLALLKEQRKILLEEFS